MRPPSSSDGNGRVRRNGNGRAPPASRVPSSSRNLTEAERRRQAKVAKLEAAIADREIPGFFATPAPVIARMLQHADIQAGDLVLEPSAGKGDIADAIRESHSNARLTCVEANAELCGILAAKGHELYHADFLALSPDDMGFWDTIVMTPPQGSGLDVDHIVHAFRFLPGGGRLVALASESSFFQQAAKFKAFRIWLGNRRAFAEKVPDRILDGGMALRMVVVDKKRG